MGEKSAYTHTIRTQNRFKLTQHNVYRFPSKAHTEVDTETVIRVWCAIVNSVRATEELLENVILSLYICEGTVGCQALLDTFPSVLSRSTALLNDGCAILCNASNRNVMVWLNKPPHYKQEIEHNPRHVTVVVGTTSLYLIR